MRYALGVIAAIAAGVANNVGTLMQNAAVARVPNGAPLMRSVLRSRLWWSSIVLQFIVGTPFYALAVGLIGPAIVPGLMSVGLIVLAVGAVVVQKERLSAKEGVGIGFVGLAVVAFGLSRLSIDTASFSLLDQGLLLRAGAFDLAMGLAAAACALAARRRRADGTEAAALLHAVGAGVLYNASNLGLGFFMAGLARFLAGIVIPAEMAVRAAAMATIVAGSLLGVAETQRALALGRAAVAIPLQNGVSQVIPVLVFFLVYRPYTPDAGSFVSLAAAIAFLVAGIVLLTGRLAPRQRPAA